MANQFIDHTAPSLQGSLPKQPQDLPHGIISPPARVLEVVAKEEERLASEQNLTIADQARQQMIEELTIQYYFDYLGYEIAYRSTPQGPEVLAVGFEEIHRRTKELSPEEQLKVKNWLP
jgi:hypothetical protein